jgi:hypothetical protein
MRRPADNHDAAKALCRLAAAFAVELQHRRQIARAAAAYAADPPLKLLPAISHAQAGELMRELVIFGAAIAHAHPTEAPRRGVLRAAVQRLRDPHWNAASDWIDTIWPPHSPEPALASVESHAFHSATTGALTRLYLPHAARLVTSPARRACWHALAYGYLAYLATLQRPLASRNRKTR